MAQFTATDSDDTFYGTSFTQGPNPASASGHIGGFGDNYYTFILWSFSGLPAGAIVTKATLSTVITGSNTTTPKPNVYRVTSSWASSTLNHATGGDILGGPTPIWDTGTIWASMPGFTITVGDVNTCDITALVQGWLAGTFSNFGLVLVPTQYTGTNHDITVGLVNNATSGNRPTLVLDYYMPYSIQPNQPIPIKKKVITM